MAGGSHDDKILGKPITPAFSLNKIFQILRSLNERFRQLWKLIRPDLSHPFLEVETLFPKQSPGPPGGRDSSSGGLAGLALSHHPLRPPGDPEKGDRLELQHVKVVVEKPQNVEAENFGSQIWITRKLATITRNSSKANSRPDETYNYGHRLRSLFQHGWNDAVRSSRNV